MPSAALTTHLDLLTDLDERGTATGVRCPGSYGRTYRLQIGYADGRVATILGSECSTVIRSDDGGGLGFAWLDP